MSDSDFKVGAVSWFDLTVQDATKVRDFYRDVVGWESTDHDMGGYADYNMKRPGDGTTVAGICHARGANANLPAQWLVYVNVADVDASAARCTERGGSVVDGPRDMGQFRFCVVRDPAGAALALLGPPSQS
jgi:hypothetical protein